MRKSVQEIDKKESGNTKKVAQKIAENLESDILEIEPKQEYTSDDIDYSNDNCRANKEMKDEKARPEIANDLSRVDSCDKVYIGYRFDSDASEEDIKSGLEELK